MSRHVDEMRALSKRYKGDALHALLAACGLRFEGMPPPPFEHPCYVRPTTRPLTEDEQAMLAQVDAELLAQRPCPVPVPTAEERFADLVERYAHESPAARARSLLRIRRDQVRYGCRRLRAGHEWSWQRPLAVVRAETATTLRQLGHAGLARRVEDARRAKPAPRQRGLQMELGP
jgi:hypothetical protein